MLATLGILLVLPTQAPPALTTPTVVEAVGKVREVGGGIDGKSRVFLNADDGSKVELHGSESTEEWLSEEQLRWRAVKWFGFCRGTVCGPF